MTRTDIVQLMADALQMPVEILASDQDAVHDEWDSVDMLGIVAAIGRQGVDIYPHNVNVVRSVAGVIGLFEEAGKLDERASDAL